VRIDIPSAGEDGLTGRHGVPVEDVHTVPLTYRGSEVGRMLVAPRTVRDPFRPADLRLLDDLGRQIGAAAHAVRLAAELQRSREEIVSAREEERRRIRRDLHDGLGPALAGIALGLDAVHRLAPSDASAASALADQLKLEVQASLADVRRLVEDLRPPALDQLGLVGAIRQQARLLSERDPGLEVTVEAHLADTLPAAVEVAAYRIATEALTNVSRHAAARHCRVGLRLNGDAVLLVEVEDDGVCEAGPATLGGTCVRARLPVGAS
jgi:signal transduction histidine kinase